MEEHQNEFDVIITDSSDPIGPAEALFERPYYECMKGALTDNGVLCTQGWTGRSNPSLRSPQLRSNLNTLTPPPPWSHTHCGSTQRRVPVAASGADQGNADLLPNSVSRGSLWLHHHPHVPEVGLLSSNSCRFLFLVTPHSRPQQRADWIHPVREKQGHAVCHTCAHADGSPSGDDGPQVLQRRLAGSAHVYTNRVAIPKCMLTIHLLQTSTRRPLYCQSLRAKPWPSREIYKNGEDNAPMQAAGLLT